MSDKLNIYQKLIEVRKSVPYLEKTKDMKGGQQAYKYNASSQVLASVREAMNAQGLMLIPAVVNARVVDSYKGGQTMTELHMTYTVVNAENPAETVVVSWYGQGCDSGEKGVGKGLTYAEKFLILKMFNIPTDQDDPDRFEAKYYDEKPATPSKVDPMPTHAPALKNVSRATVDALIAEINAAKELTPHDLDAWREKIVGWPKEYVAEVGAAVNAAKAKVK